MRASEHTVLWLLYESNLALPPRAIHWNLNDKGRKIAYSTVRKAIKELNEAGAIEKVDEKRGYYKINQQGVELFES